MAGPDAARAGAARPSARTAGDGAVPPRSAGRGVAPLAVLKALEPHGQAERGRGTPRGRPRPSYIPVYRRDWRREREEEGRRGGGWEGDPGWVEGAPRWGARGPQPPRAPGLLSGAPTLFLPASTLRQVREAGVWDLPDRGKDAGRSGRVGAPKEPGRGAGRSAGTRLDVSPADCAARADPSGLGGGWPQVDLPFPLPKSPKERVGGCVGALEHHKPHALPGARQARSRAEGVRRVGRPFPKCFPAPTGLRRACGPRGGARDKVASAPCRRPPASLSSATGDPNPHSVLGSLRRLPSRGSSKCSEPGIADFSFPVSPADASVSPIKGKEGRWATSGDIFDSPQEAGGCYWLLAGSGQICYQNTTQGPAQPPLPSEDSSVRKCCRTKTEKLQGAIQHWFSPGILSFCA
ncbi:collagen alpha-2(I) chain-like [Bos indicus x Bos taurus]|uniref:collagen alpha-2(I) chain-like n=1 Tax=Bos indicus x Bos taurus TaxID=30522 RepID=UPI000F7D2D53|nr:collagen alpha-2(I) chain-like [Bos indicus x Bos taurus]